MNDDKVVHVLTTTDINVKPEPRILSLGEGLVRENAIEGVVLSFTVFLGKQQNIDVMMFESPYPFTESPVNAKLFQNVGVCKKGEDRTARLQQPRCAYT